MSIIVVTIMLRILILPLMIKQTRSAKAMQEVQPELVKLREKYSAKDQKNTAGTAAGNNEIVSIKRNQSTGRLSSNLYSDAYSYRFLPCDNADREIGTHEFLWFQLGQPDYILPIIAGVTTFIQQKMMMVSDNPQMKMLMYMMPFMIGGFAFFFPSALALYWVIGNLFMIIQTYFITGPGARNRRDAKTADGVSEDGPKQPKAGGVKKK